MDKPLSVHEKKPTKQAKTKKKPIKVVYIANPMKVNTTASEFRALVQELTGQDSCMPLEPYKYSEIRRVGSDEMVPDRTKISDDHSLEVPRLMEPANDVPKTSDLAFEPYDDVFMPQTIQNFSGFLPSSLLL